MKPTKILFAVAEHDHAFREVLVSYLCASLERKVAFCSSNGRSLLERMTTFDTDILIVDLYLPVLSGIESIQIMRDFNKDVKILAISSVFQPDVLSLLKRSKVNGYCAKSTRDILNAFTQIVSGELFFDDSYYRKWKNSTNIVMPVNSEQLFFDKITPTELKVLLLCCEGMSNREIAARLNFSPRTVDTYLSKLFAKLNVKSRHELIRLAFNNGICHFFCRNSDMGYCEMDSIFL